ncbi:hypothetical protein JQ604_20320 [Bradyrhizobium jicamae]|uniref:hypothetical protein n=1 Tax=Bradyrhizobium jicamae TaxID=280332 RepID=UPI001BAD26F6|nr:hypothetical protein [Bradyrhizobium jicamae]MBR0754537.1 hypothetical protein [Bradyrhizobium jicamae]
MISGRRALQLQMMLYIAAALFFTASLFLPAVETVEANHDPDRTQQWVGWWLLLFGPFAVFKWQFGWFANPLMLLSAIPWPPYVKIAFACAAIALVISTVTATSMHVMDAELVVKSVRLGFDLWFACPFLLLLAALVKPDGQIIGACNT